MRRFNPVPSFLLLPLLALMLISVPVPSASGQTPNRSPEVKPSPSGSPQQSSSPEASTIPSRRTATALPEPEAADNKIPSTSSDATLVSEQSDVPKSEVDMLRDEINDATNEQERGRLQLKLVDHLVSAGRQQDAIAHLKAMSEEERFDPQGF